MCANIKNGGKGGFSTNESWNKGKKGLQVAWNKGLDKRDERVRKYSEAKIGRHRIEWNKVKKNCQIPWNKGVKNTTHKGKEIIQMSLNGEFICEYVRIRDAAKKYGINERLISKCCKGIISEYKWYKWKFKDER